MKWTKASERLPGNKFKSVIVRDLTSGHVGTGKTMGHDSLMSVDFANWERGNQFVKYVNLEWLDESTPSEQEAYWKKRCEAAEEVIDRFGEPPHEMASEMGKRIYREWQSLKSDK